MYVPVEVGFWTHPRVVAFARAVGNPDAGAWLIRLREFMLVHDHATGHLNGTLPEEIAALMQATCTTRVLMAALKRYRFLKRDGSHYFAPDWKGSPMHHYSQRRIRKRSDARRWRARMRGAQTHRGKRVVSDRSHARSPTVRTGRDGHVDVTCPPRSTKRRVEESRVEEKIRSPHTPQGGCERVGAARWAWMQEHYPKLRYPDRCKQILGMMTSEEWRALQAALPKQVREWREKLPRYTPSSELYLRRSQWLEVRPAAKPAPSSSATPRAAPAAKSRKPPADSVNAQRDQARTYLAALLADPDASAERKEKAKAKHQEKWHEKPWEEAA